MCASGPRVAGVVAVGSFAASLAVIHAVETGAVALPATVVATLYRTVPIFLTAVAMVRAFNGASARTNLLLVAGPCLAYTLHTFVPALGPAGGVAAGIASGAGMAGLVAGAGHATGRGYRELVSAAVDTEDGPADRGEEDVRR